MAGMRKLKGRWYIRVFLEDGKEKLLPTRTGDKKRAEALKRQIEEKEFLVRARLAEQVDRGSCQLHDFADEFLAECKTRLRPSTVDSYTVSLENLKDCWGNLDLRQLTARHLSLVRAYLSSRVNPTTANIRLRSIRAFLNWLVSTEKIERLPGKLALVKVDEALPKFFTPEEIAKIFKKVSDPKLKSAFKVLAGTGMRRSELFHCELKDGYLHLHQTKGRRDRLVALPPALIEDYLLATEYPYRPNTLTQAFTRAVRKAGVDPKGRSLHSLRHTFALQEYFRTGDIYFVKQALGHSHVTITERYLKFPIDYLQQVFGESITPYHADQRWANLSEGKPAFQA